MVKKIFKISTWLIVGFVAAVFTGCSNDLDDEFSLFGEWVEDAPVYGRTELNFYSNNRVTMTSDGAAQVYIYSVDEDSMILRPDGEPEENGTSLFFKQINEHSFQIENLYPAIPEMEPTFMIFVRKSSIRE